ncbi:hypothetical protein AAMO2058_001247900 [Amorphochlora amoebiformis]
MGGGLWQNVGAALVSVAMVLIAVPGCNYLVKKKKLSRDMSRKIVHISGSCWLVTWPYFDKSHWGWKLNIIVPACYVVMLIVKGLIIQDRRDIDVRTMSRSGDPIELVKGPLMFTLLMCVVGLTMFDRDEGYIIMAAVGWGDGIAPWVGKMYGKHKYKLAGRQKSYEGSVGCFLGTLLGMQVFRIFTNHPRYNPTLWSLCALVGTLVEAV